MLKWELTLKILNTTYLASILTYSKFDCCENVNNTGQVAFVLALDQNNNNNHIIKINFVFK